MTFKTVARGETIERLADNHRIFQAKKTFWLGPFALLHPGHCFFVDDRGKYVDREGRPQTGRAVVMPCGYSEIDDVELSQSEEGLQKLLADGWVEEIDKEGNPVIRRSRWEVLSQEGADPWWKRLLRRCLS